MASICHRLSAAAGRRASEKVFCRPLSRWQRSPSFSYATTTTTPTASSLQEENERLQNQVAELKRQVLQQQRQQQQQYQQQHQQQNVNRPEATNGLLASSHSMSANGHDGSKASSPFDQLRVLDLSRVLAGPYCTMHLGDLGAEVIKVEHVNDGDETRSWGPPFVEGESSYFLGVNRSKKSLALDFKKSAGRQVLRELAAKSDVLIQNFLPGALEKYGLGYDDLREINPRLIYVTLTGYGPDGPDAQKPGYDVIVSARGGLMGITGEAGGPPCKVGVAVTDLATGLSAFASIMAALWARERGGPTCAGQRIDVSLLETQVSLLANIGSAFLIAGKEGGRHGTAHPSIVPYQAVATQDGYLVFGATNNAAFSRFCEALGLQDSLLVDPRFKDNASRVKHRDALIQRIEECFARYKTSDLARVLDSAAIVNSPINTISQVFSDPQVLARDMVQEVFHPLAGNIKLTGPAAKYSQTPARIRSAPPLLGQHSSQVLRDVLGRTDQEIQALVDEGVIRLAP